MKYRVKFLYHGTSSEQRFEEDGETPNGPAWFSNSTAVADWFSKYRKGFLKGITRHGDHLSSRVLVYRVVSHPNLFKFNEKKMKQWSFENFGFEDWRLLDSLELSDLVLWAGYDGWIIEDNYCPGGHDIMIVSPEKHLEFVKVLGEITARRTSARRISRRARKTYY